MTDMTVHARHEPGQSIGPATVPRVEEPTLSQPLRVALLRISDKTDTEAASSISDTTRAEAQAAVARYEELLRPATALHLAGWLGAVNANCRIPMDQKPLATKVKMLVPDLVHLPEACFTPETRRAVARLNPHFPGLGDILAVCDPIADEWKRQRARLRRVAGGGGYHSGRRGPPPEMTIAEVPTAEEQKAAMECHESAKAAVAAKAKAFRAEMQALEREAAPEKPRPIYLTPAQELAEWKAIAAARPGPDGDGARRMVALFGGEA